MNKSFAILIALCVFVGLFSVAVSTSCSAAYQCYGVSTSPNYVNCVNGQCQCLSGFQGNGTSNDKCRCDFSAVWGTSGVMCKKCDAPAQFVYLNGNPYCIDGPTCEAAEADNDRQQIRIDKVKQIYQNLIGVAPLLIITGQKSIADIFAPDVRGRVTPLGKFDEFQLVLEYFYGLSASAGVVTQTVFTHVSASGNRVAVSVDIFFNYPPGGIIPPQNLTQVGFYTFNDDNLVTSFDLNILNLGAAVDSPEFAHPAQIQQMCNVVSGPHGTCSTTFADNTTCIAFMNSIPFGSWNRANSNTVTCRLLHTLLTPFRPDVHCPHVSPSGGGHCIDFTYESYYEDSF